MIFEKKTLYQLPITFEEMCDPPEKRRLKTVLDIEKNQVVMMQRKVLQNCEGTQKRPKKIHFEMSF